MISRLSMLLVCCMVLFSSQSGLGHEGSEKYDKKQMIDDVMTTKLSTINHAFIQFDKTKSPKDLVKIKKLNEAAGEDLFKWWDSVTAPCCNIKKGQDPRVTYKEAVEKHEPVLTQYLRTICYNYTRIAGSYLQVKNKKKAKLIYQLVLDSYEPSKYDACVKEAENGLKNL